MGRFILIAVVILAMVGGYMWYSGNIGTDSQGNLAVSAPDAPGVDAPQASKYAEGNMHFGASKYQSAIAAYEAALKEDPKDPQAPEAMYRIGKSYDELDRPQEAVDAYRRLIKEHPNSGQVGLATKRMGFLVESGGAK